MSLRASAHKNHGMIATGNHFHYRFAARSTTGVAIRSPFGSFVVKVRKGMRIATPVTSVTGSQ